MFAVRTGNSHCGAASMTGLPTNGMQQQRSAGDGLAMMVRIGQAYEQIPPIEYQGHRARQPTTFDVSCRKASPASVISEFVKCVLTVCAIAVKLANRQDLRG
jgi:hypothetical protein